VFGSSHLSINRVQAQFAVESACISIGAILSERVVLTRFGSMVKKVRGKFACVAKATTEPKISLWYDGTENQGMKGQDS